MKKNKTYVFDLDNTLCNTEGNDYEKSYPLENRIERVNQLYDEGNYIIINTARGMGRSKNNVDMANSMLFDFTKNQIEAWGLRYHLLFLGKPAGDFYIDDKGMNSEDFFTD